MEDYNTKKVDFIYHNSLHLQQDVQDKLSQIPEADQKTPLATVFKLYQEFSKAHALYPFKDAYKRLRKLLKDHPELYSNEETRPVLEDLVFSLLKECTFGQLRDIKGLISELLENFASQEHFGPLMRQVFQDECREFLERVISEGENDEEKVKREGWTLNLDKIDDTIRLMNHFGDLLCVLGTHSESLVQPFLKVHTIVLRQLTTSFENNKHIAVKFLQVLAEEMRNAITVVSFYKHELQVQVGQDDTEVKIDLMTISLSCRIYLCSINRMNHEAASQCSILAVLIDSVILNVKEDEFEHFHLVENEIQSSFSIKTYTQTEDVLKMKQLSIIRSLVICKDGFDIFQKFKSINESAYSLAINACVEPNTNLRHYAFKTLAIVLEPIQNREETRRKFFEKGNQHLELFELLLKNWESPIKGITHQIEEVLRMLIKILGNQSGADKDRTIEDLKERIISLNAGNSKKKYNALAVLLEHIDVELLLAENKGLIYELLSSSGDVHLAASVTLLEKILAKLLHNLSENKAKSKEAVFEAWTQYWVDDFVLCIERENFNVVRALMLHITPMLCNLSVGSTGFLVNLLMKKDLTRKNYLWCFVSLLKSARANNLLEYTPDQQGYRFKEIAGSVKTDLTIDVSFIKKMLLNSNRNIMLSILELLTTSPKPADPPAVFEYSLITEYLKYNLRTSYSDFRNNTVTVLKKFFIRIRKIYEANLVKYFPVTKTEFPAAYLDNLGPKDAKANFKAVTSFLKNSFHTLTQELRPEGEYEAVFPVVEIIKLIFQIFGLSDSSYKRTHSFKGISLLYFINAFNPNFFTYLLLCLRSSWDMVRFSAQEILQGFPDDHHLLSADYLHTTLLPIAEDLTKNPVIRNAEGGALILSLIDKKFVNKIDFNRIDFAREGRDLLGLTPSLKFAYYVLGLLEKRFKKLQEHFLTDSAEYANNLIHGLITALGLLVQDLPKSEELKAPENKTAFRNFFHDLSETLGRVLSYATKLSADNISTCILDNNTTVKKFNNEIQVNKPGSTDCRGHFMSGSTEDSNVMAKLKNIENILYGNTLMETLDEGTDFDVENIIVVSFYLITRESGLLFQNISNLILSLDETNSNFVDQDDLQLLVDIYFHSLLNLKHLGSIDRIAHGLSTLCKSMYETKNPILPNLAEELLDKILDAIEQGDFKNVLRRSAGIPPAIICLLKSEPYGKKSRLFPKVMRKLFDFAENSTNNEIKVHSLNILKFVFQDSNLRADIEGYISQGFIAAIRGFSSTDWAIRNSALMLFSSIAKRTIGCEKVADSSSVKSSINIVEFFTRAPQLVDFFYKEVQDYVQNAEQKKEESLYPSLYPIALIMSRLLPYDLKNNYLRRAIEAEEQTAQTQTQQEGVVAEAGEDQKEHRKFVTMEELRKFLPQFIRAAHNKNYMGRLMCARAVLPFIPYETIVDQVIEILEMENLTHFRTLKTDHNFAHGLLLQVYYIIKNHFRLQESYPYETNRFRELLPVLIGYLSERRWIMIYVKCAFIPTVYLQIMKKLLKYIGDEEDLTMREIFAYIYGYSLQTFKEECKDEKFRIVPDFGHSILRLKHLEYVLTYDRVTSQNLDSYKDILQMFVDKYTTTLAQRRHDDNEPFQVLLRYWNKFLKLAGNTNISEQDKAWTLQQVVRLLSQNDFIATEFLPCISEIFSIILNIGCENVISTDQTIVLLRCLETLFHKFAQNSRLMKSVIKAYGVLLPVYLQRTTGQREGSNFVSFYITLCEKYSHSGQIDSLRVAVIKSFKLSLKPITDRVQDIESFLGLSRVVIRLLQDEIPEIRSKMASFVSRIFKIEEDKYQFKFNPNYILEVYFNFIVQRYQQWGSGVHQKDQIALNQFILSYIFESEFDKYMELAHYEKRIFAVEKPNKFYSDFVIKRIAYDVYLSMLEKKIVSHYDLKTFLDSQKYKFKEFSERNVDKYLTDVINRNEYLFESMLKRLYQDCLIKKTESIESDFYVKMKENIGLLEPYLRDLIESA